MLHTFYIIDRDPPRPGPRDSNANSTDAGKREGLICRLNLMENIQIDCAFSEKHVNVRTMTRVNTACKRLALEEVMLGIGTIPLDA